MEIGQQQKQETVKRNQLFELTPPMDPSSSSSSNNDKNNNIERQFSNKNIRHLNTIYSPPTSFSSQRPRPTNLPGLSSGLAAISANYGGGIFDQNNDDHLQNSPINENIQQQQNPYSVCSLSEQFTPLVAAAAYAFRHPQSTQFNSITPSLYSPYEGSQPSDPNTPTQQFGSNNSSTMMLSSINQQLHNQQHLIATSSEVGNVNNSNSLTLPPPTYAATVSSMAAAAAATTPFDASILWNWSPLFGCGNGTELIGYATEHQNNLLFNSATAAQHLLAPPFDFCTTQHQQIDSSPCSILLDNNSIHQQQQHHLWLAEQFAEAAISSGTSPTCAINKLTINSEKQQTATTTASSVFVPPLSIVSKPLPLTATVSAMPRGQPRKGGRRPREQTGECQLSGEDKDRLAKRRVRNKEAAARCRQRRQLLIQTLEGQVAHLQTTNSEKDRKIKELQNEQNRLLGILAQREGGGSSVHSIQDYKESSSSFKFEQQQDDERFSTFSSNSMVLHQQNGNNSRGGGGIGILIPQLEHNKVRQHHCVSLPICQHSSSSSSSAMADTTESTGISPTTPPQQNMFYSQGRMDNNISRGGVCSVLVIGSDPIISDSALIETPTSSSHCSPSFGHIKRSKLEPQPLLVKVEENSEDCSNNVKQLYQFESPTQRNLENINNNVRPNSLNFKGFNQEDDNLRGLIKAGYTVTTPSRGLLMNGSYQNVTSSFLNTLGNNNGCADTPDVVSQFTESISQSYGVLGAQQLGITPCQNGPVLVQTSLSSADSLCEQHPPNGGELSILR